MSEMKKMVLSTNPMEMQEKGLVRLYQDEALTMIETTIDKWEQPNEVFFLKNTPHMTFLGGSVTGILLSNKLIPQLIARKDVFKGKIITSLIASIVPGITCFFISKGWMNELYLKRVSCPTCDEIRFISNQVGFGFVFPTFLSLFGSYSILYANYKLSFGPGTKEWFKWCGKNLHSNRHILSGILLLQIIGSVLITKCCFSQLNNFREQLQTEKEQKSIEFVNLHKSTSNYEDLVLKFAKAV